MTMYPLILHLGPLEITGYGIMMMLCFIASGWVMALECKRLGFNAEYANDVVFAAVIGGILGAKLWYVALYGDLSKLFDRGGLVFYGGFFGGVLLVMLNGWRRKVPLRWTMHLTAPAIAIGYSIGRIGCLLVNDDYGRPTTAWWGVKFPQGYPPSTAENMKNLFGIPIPDGMDPKTVLAVHPTQIFETVLMGLAFLLLWKWRKKPKPVGWLFGVYLILGGLERFAIEILRAKDDRFVGPFTLAQVTSVVLVAVGIVIVNAWKNSPKVEPGPYLKPQSGTGATPERTLVDAR